MFPAMGKHRSALTPSSRSTSVDDDVPLACSTWAEALLAAAEVTCSSERVKYLSHAVRLISTNSARKDPPATDTHSDFDSSEISRSIRQLLSDSHSFVRLATVRILRHFLSLDESALLAVDRENICLILVRAFDMSEHCDRERQEYLRLFSLMMGLYDVDAGDVKQVSAIVRALLSVVESDERLRCVCLEILCEFAIRNPSHLRTVGLSLSWFAKQTLSSTVSTQLVRVLTAALIYLFHSQSACDSIAALRLLTAPLVDCSFLPGSSSLKDSRLVLLNDAEHCASTCEAILVDLLTSYPAFVLCTKRDSHLRQITRLLRGRQTWAKRSLVSVFGTALEFRKASRSRNEAPTIVDGFIVSDLLHEVQTAHQRYNLAEVYRSALLKGLLESKLADELVELILSSNEPETIGVDESENLSQNATHLLAFVLAKAEGWYQTQYLQELTTAVTYPLLDRSTSRLRIPSLNLVNLEDTIALYRSETRPRGFFLGIILDDVFGGGGGSDMMMSMTPTLIGGGALATPQSAGSLSPSSLTSSEQLTPVNRVSSSPFLDKDEKSWQKQVEQVVQEIREALSSEPPPGSPDRDWIQTMELVGKIETFLPYIENRDVVHRYVDCIVQYFQPTGGPFTKISEDSVDFITKCGCRFFRMLALANSSASLAGSLQQFLVECNVHLCGDRLHGGSFAIRLADSSAIGLRYFLFLGVVSRFPNGQIAMEETGIYQKLFDLVHASTSEVYVKAIVSLLYFGARVSRLAKNILAATLRSTRDACRVYATHYVAYVMTQRLVENEVSQEEVARELEYVLELLSQQLMDPSLNVVAAAVSGLDYLYGYKFSEGMAEQERNITPFNVFPLPPMSESLRSTLIQCGDAGVLLATYGIADTTDLVTGTLMELWADTYMERYVDIIDELMHELFSSYKRSLSGGFPRPSGSVGFARSPWLPPHIFSALARTERGRAYLSNQASSLVDAQLQIVESQTSVDESPTSLRRYRGAMWALAHLVWALPDLLLLPRDILASFIALAERSRDYVVSYTALQCINLMARNSKLDGLVRELGWSPGHDGGLHGFRPEWGDVFRSMSSTCSDAACSSGRSVSGVPLSSGIIGPSAAPLRVCLPRKMSDLVRVRVPAEDSIELDLEPLRDVNLSDCLGLPTHLDDECFAAHGHLLTEDEMNVRKEFWKLGVTLSNPFRRLYAEQGLLKLLDAYQSVFSNPCLYTDACRLLCSLRYPLAQRRFLQDLFLEADLSGR